MSGYVFSVMGVVLMGSILTAIMPDGKMMGIVKGMTKLVCLLVILSPIFQYFTKIKGVGKENFYQDIFGDSVIETDADFIKYYSESAILFVEEALEKEIMEKYAIPVSVSIDWEYFNEDNLYDKIKIQQISVCANSPISEEEQIVLWEYLTTNYCSEVLIE